ncbi:MAG: hypothetical protein R3E79_16305 [Caldilineaceae bacterium]
MIENRVTFPNQQTMNLPAQTAAIQAAKANYATPLWQYRAERTLELGSHQWIYPHSVATARVVCLAPDRYHCHRPEAL